MKLESPTAESPKTALILYEPIHTVFRRKKRSLPHVSNQEGKLHDMTVLSNQLMESGFPKLHRLRNRHHQQARIVRGRLS